MLPASVQTGSMGVVDLISYVGDAAKAKSMMNGSGPGQGEW